MEINKSQSNEKSKAINHRHLDLAETWACRGKGKIYSEKKRDFRYALFRGSFPGVAI